MLPNLLYFTFLGGWNKEYIDILIKPGYIHTLLCLRIHINTIFTIHVQTHVTIQKLQPSQNILKTI